MKGSSSFVPILLFVVIGACSVSGGETPAQNSDSGTPPSTLPESGASDSWSDANGEDAEVDAQVAPPPFVVDVPNVVRRSTIVLGKPNTAPKDAMALGNGTLGVATWAANGFSAQLNRADAFPDRKSAGQVTIPGLAKMTTATDFAGQVDLYDATLRESGGGMHMTAFVRADSAELVVDVDGADPNVTQTAQIKLWAGRSPKAAVSNGIGVLAETWQDNNGLGASGNTFGSFAAITAGGRNVKASMIDAMTVQLDFQPNADGTFRVIVAAPSWSGGDAMAAATTALGTDTSAASSALAAGHLAYWHDYWGHVGLMKLTSSDGTAEYMEALRTIYLYIAASERGGDSPGSQAGVADLFNDLQDKQAWFPSGYWFWNTRMMLAANLTSGAFSLNEPIYHLYQSNLANMQAWTQTKMSGRKGICLPETMRFNGNGYYNGGEDDASCDETIAPSYNALTVTSGAEVALWIWQQYLITGDRAFLTTNYPLMRESAVFLLAYATAGADGLLHTVANAHETQWKVKDPTTDIVAMRALFQAVIAATNTLATSGADASIVPQLQAALTKLPALPRTDAATHNQLLTAADDAAGQDVFAISYEPSAARHNGENLDLEAVWPYGLIGDDGADIDLAKRTFQHRTSVHAPDWSCDALQAARLGLGSEVASALTSVTQSYQRFVNGMALLGGGTNDGTSEPYSEQAGVVAAALNEAFVQSYDGVVRIAPAVPSGWDATGTVYIQGGSKIDFDMQGGKVTFAILESGSTGTVNVRNPWPSEVVVVRDGASGKLALASTTSAMLTFGAVAGHWYAIALASAPNPLPFVQMTGVPATKSKTLGPVSIGL